MFLLTFVHSKIFSNCKFEIWPFVKHKLAVRNSKSHDKETALVNLIKVITENVMKSNVRNNLMSG